MSEIKRVKIDSIIESQIPEFINEEYPIFVEFLKSYYLSQEHQSGVLDLANNLKKYKNIAAFTNINLSSGTSLVSGILPFDTTIFVDSIDGWPEKYGLLKIDDEIITYTGSTNNTITGTASIAVGSTIAYYSGLPERCVGREFTFKTNIEDLDGNTIANPTIVSVASTYVVLSSTGITSTSVVGFNSTGNYLFQTNIPQFNGCIRGFSAIDSIKSIEDSSVLSFSSTEATDHLSGSHIQNLSNLFLIEFFEKFKGEFFTGFEGRNFYNGVSVENILLSARDFYSSKGTDTSYKFLFKVLYGKDIEIIKPQDFTLTPSANSYFTTKNVLVEQISGVEPNVKGNFLYQDIVGVGTASASIYNIEYRPVGDKNFYEISLDSNSFTGSFSVSGKTKILKGANIGDTSLLVDSTVGFSKSGSFVVKPKNSIFIEINYTDKTTNQFLGVSGITKTLDFGLDVTEQKFAYSYVGTGNTSKVEFRLVNIIDNVDYSKTSNLVVGDKLKLVGFGRNLRDENEFNSWIYNIPTVHNVLDINLVDSQKYRIYLYDAIPFYLNEVIIIENIKGDFYEGSIFNIEYPTADVLKKRSKRIVVQVSDVNFEDKDIIRIRKKILLSNSFDNYFDSIGDIPTGVQNTYIDYSDENFYVTSTGFPNYTIFSTDNKKNISAGSGTSIFETSNHNFNTGELIYYSPKNSDTSGISTGSYYVTKLTSDNLKLSYSKSDIFSKKYIFTKNDGISNAVIIKSGYENKTLKNQKLLKKFPLNRINSNFDNENQRTTNNREIGILVNGTELLSPTVFDENIFYGKLDSIEVTNKGKNYDVINSPTIDVIDSSGIGAKVFANLVGNVSKVNIISPGIGYEVKPKITLSGGNGEGCVLDCNLVSSRIFNEINGKYGVNTIDNSISFLGRSLFSDAEEIIYNSNGNDNISGLISGSNYFVGIVTESQVKVYNTKLDAIQKVNAIDITAISTGSHLFESLRNKNTITEIYVKNSGKNYSNRSVKIPSVPSVDNNTVGINTFDSYFFAKNYNFNDGDLVQYSTTDTPISGLSTDAKYYLSTINSNKFRLSYAGIGTNLSKDNYLNKIYVSFSNIGVGTHKISYPPIEIKVESISVGSTSIIEPIFEPIVLGSIQDVFIENGGVGYGCTNIINFHRRPDVGISSVTLPVVIKPIIINGSITNVKIVSKGNGYRKDSDITIETKSGKYAELIPIIDSEGKLSSVNIINGGVGYEVSDTSLVLKNRGTDAQFLANVKEWKINQVVKSADIISKDDGGILYPTKNPDLGLKFINFYVPKILRYQLGDNFNTDQLESSITLRHSPILGWAYDGNPIYGPYGFDTPQGGNIRLIKPSYVLNQNVDPGLRPQNQNPGYFIEDYVYDSSGDLDEYNGRFCVTPEYPNGVYAYFCSIDVDVSKKSSPKYPYIIGSSFKDSPIEENFVPKFNQDLDIFTKNLNRNISPYYYNYTNSFYDLLEKVSDKLKQEFRIQETETNNLNAQFIISPGKDYQVGDRLVLNRTNSGGSPANIVVSELEGQNVNNFSFVENRIDNVEFITNNYYKVLAKTSSPHGLIEKLPISISGISTVTSEILGGVRYPIIQNKNSQLVFDINDLITTGFSTYISVTDINGFDVNDFIKIDNEILLITNISLERSRLLVNRIQNTSSHGVGSTVTLLPKKFEFNINDSIEDITFENKVTFFNPQETVGTGTNGITRYLVGIGTSSIESRFLPTKTIYIPNHKFYTGQSLTYDCGVGGTSLVVRNVGSSYSFRLEKGQTVYAYNVDNNHIGLSDLGFTTTTGIGTTSNTLEFLPLNLNTVGTSHSLSTNNLTITGTVLQTSGILSTTNNHNLSDNDIINLKVTTKNIQEIKVIYDFVNRKISLNQISFGSTQVFTSTNEIDISSYNYDINTGDKLVYISGNIIGGLENYGSYYAVKTQFDRIKLCNNYSDIKSSNFIDLTSDGGINNQQQFYFINPPVSVIRGNTLKFDMSDPSLFDMDIDFYYDSEFSRKIGVIGNVIDGFALSKNGIPGTSESYIQIDTSNPNIPLVLYYRLIAKSQFSGNKTEISSDYSVLGRNKIILKEHALTGEHKVTVLDSKTFSFVSDNKLSYIEGFNLSVSDFSYSTKSVTAKGPIKNLKVNFAGRGYSEVPFVEKIETIDGKDAVIKIFSNSIGKIKSLERVKDGFDYPTDATLNPTLSIPTVVGIKNIRTIDYIGIVTGGKGYNTNPSLFVKNSPDIKLSCSISGGSVVSTKIVTNSTQLSGPLDILTLRNSNGHEIDAIQVNGNQVTLELLNSDYLKYGYDSVQSEFPFSIGDKIFIENCRLTPVSVLAYPSSANFNSSSYDYSFFNVIGVSTANNTITYDMTGIKTDTFGSYDNSLNFGSVVNKKNMPIFEMVLKDTVNYISKEKVTSTNFTARVMENGWNGNLNILRLTDCVGTLGVGNKLFGEGSKVNGTVEFVESFDLKSTLGLLREKVGNIDNSVGILNDSQQKISDNFYYQKFSYSIKGEIPYSIWRESVRSTIHPSGFKEFSDLVLYSEPSINEVNIGLAKSTNLKPKLNTSTSSTLINIDNEISMYLRDNFAVVYEESLLPDGSTEDVYIAEGSPLLSYVLNKTNKVLLIDDISGQFDGTSLQILNKRYSDASYLLDINRSFIQEEVVGFITATYPGISTAVGWDRDVYKTDVGYIIDAISHDAKYNSNDKSIEFGLTYLSGIGTNYLLNQKIVGFNYIINLSKYVINNVQFPTSYQTPSFTKPQQFNNNLVKDINCNSLTYSETCYADVWASMGTYVGIITNIIGIGTTAVPTPIYPSITRSGSIVGLTTFKLTNNGTPLFKRTFDSTSSTIIDLDQNKFIFPNHNFQTGQELIYDYGSGVPIGIGTTSYLFGGSIINSVGTPYGTALYENGYSVAISTTITGISTILSPVGPSAKIYNQVKGTNGVGIATFNVLITYSQSTGQPLSTSIILLDGGNSFVVGDTVSIAGTYIGGSSPTNNLTFNVSATTPTKIASGANTTYSNITDSFGNATFNISRDGNGYISNLSVINGGSGYATTSIVSIAGTYIGGLSPQDTITFSPTSLSTNKLPISVYVNKINDNEFRLSGLSTSLYLNLQSFGVGIHTLTYKNPNSSVLITIDGIIQKPLTNKSLNITLDSSISSASTTTISVVSGISSLKGGDIINIDNEYLLIKSIGIPNYNSIQVQRGFLGSVSGVHTVGASCTILSGNFNIVGDNLYFTTSPYGKIGPTGLQTSSSFSGRIFSRSFDGRSPQDKNIVLDDISLSFTGIAATEFVLKTNGQSTQTLFNSVNSSTTIDNNPFILINNVLQVPNKDYVIDGPTQNTIRFISGTPKSGRISKVAITTGFGYTPFLPAAATVTVSAAGTISSITVTGGGSGYRQSPSVSIASTIGLGASIIANVSAAGTISGFYIVNPGSGYTTSSIPVVSIGIATGYSNLGIAYTSIGTTIYLDYEFSQTNNKFNVTYVKFDNSSVAYVGSGNTVRLGQGAKVSVSVGQGSSVISFKIDNPGVGYKPGDVLYVPDLLTNTGIGSTLFQDFKIVIQEVESDTFNGFYPGQFLIFEDISDQFNSIRKKFTLRTRTLGTLDTLSLKVPTGSDLDIANNLFIFINDVLQVPNYSYTIQGSRVFFNEPPKANSTCTVLYYRGSSSDVELVTPRQFIKSGDLLTIKKSYSDPLSIPQDDRTIKTIYATDTIKTFPYGGLGISTNNTNYKPASFTKQLQDRIINGKLVSKSRPDLQSNIRPNANIINNVTTTDTQIYVDNAFPLFTSVDNLSEDLNNIFIFENKEISASIATCVVSLASTISSVIISDGGTGYDYNLSPEVSFSGAKITRKDPIYQWNSSYGIPPTYQLNDITFNKVFVAVGDSSVLSLSNDGQYWTSSSVVGVASTSINLKAITSVGLGDTSLFVSVGNNANIIKSVGYSNTISTWQSIRLLDERSYPGFGVIARVDSSYNKELRDIVYATSYDTFVTVGAGGSIFTGVGIGTDAFINRYSQTITDLNSVAFSTNDSINFGYFIAVGNNGTILSSSTGLVWDVDSSPTSNALRKVIYVNGKFVIVGDTGTVITSSISKQYDLINTNVLVDFVNISYSDQVYVAVTSSGDLYYSFDLSEWVYRSTSQVNVIKSIAQTPLVGLNGRVVLVGSSGTSIFSEPVYHRASGIASVSSGVVTSIFITDGGFGYDPLDPPPVIIQEDNFNKENILSIKVKGDFGTIIGINTFVTGTTGIGTTSPKVEFVLKSNTYDNGTLGIGYSSLDTFGISYSQLEKGDYFVITNSNVSTGHPLVGITTLLGGMSGYPNSKVGTAVSFIDGVYRVEYVTNPVSGIVTVTCNFAPKSPTENYVQVYQRGPSQSGIGTNNFYGNYSWSKIYDYQNRSGFSPKSFTVDTDSGITGILSGPKVVRTRGLISN
jgi:hypothetical protein